MNLIQECLDLQRQKKIVRRDMKEKRAAITREMRTEDIRDFGINHACIQTIDVFDIAIGGKFIQMEVAQCDAFCENYYCPNGCCYMARKNYRYINSVQLYESIKQTQGNLIKNALKIKSK